MSDQKCPAPEELSFEAALAELDEVVAALEGGQLELEESIVRYQRGVALLLTLQNKLADAQQKVTMLIGELETGAAGETATPAAQDSTAAEDDGIPF